MRILTDSGSIPFGEFSFCSYFCAGRVEHMLSVGAAVGKCTLITGSRLKVPEQQDHMGRRRYITATVAPLQSVDTTSL